MQKAVFCTVKTTSRANDVVDRLKSAGFSSNDISVMMSDTTGAREFAQENETKAPEGAAVGAGGGAMLGGALGWLTGIGALAIPGLGPFIAAGPIMAALGGAALGGAVGGVTGALVGLGIPEDEATRYEDRLRGGSAMISVHSENAVETERARQIFEDAGAEDISISRETASMPR